MSALLLLAALLAARPQDPAPAADEVLGGTGMHVVMEGESLVELARLYDVGFNEMAAANPRLDPWVPRAGATAVVPTEWILPDAASPGDIAVNLSEMRLYLLPEGGGAPVTFPVGVAVEPASTPLGTLTVVSKSVLPTWYPTASSRKEDPTLPAAVPPGPENPLGSHALRLSKYTLLIHGTNKPFGVGRKVSHGCLRLYPEDIPQLYELVPVGTRVHIVREPVKVGLRQGRVLVEAHEDDTFRGDALAEARRLLRRKGLLDRVDGTRLTDAIQARSGLPVDVTDDRS